MRLRIGILMTALAAGVAALALTAASAPAVTVSHPGEGRLPGFPAIRGVIPVLGSKAALSAREKLVGEAFAAARARHAQRPKGVPVPSEALASCKEEVEEELTFLTQDVCYRGGPVLHDPVIHLIFWQGPVTPEVKPFPAAYESTVEQYFEDVAHDSSLETNVFAVDPQYFEEPGIKASFRAGEYKLAFNRASDVTVDTSAFPTHVTGGCEDETQFSKGPCLLDSDLQKEVETVAKTSTKGLGDIYVVLTPPGVGGCFEEASSECAYEQYCAYHGDFGGNGRTPGQQTLYVDLPYLGEVAGCDSGVHPNEVVSEVEEEEGRDSGADAVIDTASHELNEAVTDPIGSQCDEEGGKIVGCEKNAWTDAIGQEIGDKCLPPESTVLGVYGEPLGELLAGRPASLFNQLIDGDHYWTQREWSNEAGLGEGACVQRRIKAGFTISAGPRATVPATLDGSPSGAPGDPAVYWVWNFGEGEQIGTASPTLTHTFAQPGIYRIGLTAYDVYGNSQATTEFVEVAPAPAQSSSLPPAPAPPISVSVVKEPTTPGHLTAAQLATKLGLPGNGRKLSGAGPFALGHAECPPACGVTLRLYAKVTSVAHGRRTTRLVQIGSARMTLAAKGKGALTLSLNAKGRALLRKGHALACELVVTIEDQEGGTWQIVRALTLSGGAGAARHARG